MLDKIKNGFNLVIIFIFIIAFIYFIVITIINIFSPTKNIDSTNISMQNVDIYISDDRIIKDYSTFFNVEVIIQNIILNLNKGNYDNIYSTFSSEEKNNIKQSYFDSNIKQYVDNNFRYDVNEEMDSVGYKNYNNLKMLYSVNDNEYIAVVTSINGFEETKIGIKLLTNNKYMITYLEL